MGGENASVALDTDTNAPRTPLVSAAGRGGTIAEVIAQWTGRHLAWSDPVGTVEPASASRSI